MIFVRWILISLLFVALGSLSKRSLSVVPDANIPLDDVSFQWHPTLYRIVTFGHTPAAVNLLLIRFFGEDTLAHVKEGTRARAFYLLDLATDLDPAFFHLYNTGANYLTVVRNDNLGALKIADKGEHYRKNILPQMPQFIREVIWEGAWRIPFVKGYIHLFEFDDLANAKVAYGELDRIPGVPGVIRNLADRFNQPEGEYDVGLRVLQTMLWSEQEKKKPDMKVIRELEGKMKSLSLSRGLKKLNMEFDGFLLKTIRTSDRQRISHDQLEKLWIEFANMRKVPHTDEWGGRIYFDQSGRVNSTTPRMKVLGLE